MKRDGRYRFSLQFGADSDMRIRAGELLERLGNRKSAVVVAAVNDYIAAHPEIEAEDCRRIYVRLESGVSREAVERLVLALIDERLAKTDMRGSVLSEAAGGDGAASLDENIARLLSNLEVFETGR